MITGLSTVSVGGRRAENVEVDVIGVCTVQPKREIGKTTADNSKLSMM